MPSLCGEEAEDMLKATRTTRTDEEREEEHTQRMKVDIDSRLH
jgi:hypothetical protein